MTSGLNVGQLAIAGAGYVVGGVLGGAAGGSVGMSIGYLVGGWLFPPKAPKPNAELGELGVNSYIRSMPVAIGYGMDLSYPGIIFIGNNAVRTTNVGKKKSPEYETSYTADFAAAVGEGFVYQYCEYFINDKSIKDLTEEDAISLHFDEYAGTPDQPINSILASFLSGKSVTAISFKNTAYVVASGKIGTQNSLPTLSIETRFQLTETNEKDANPIKVLYDFLVNKIYGVGLSTDLFDGGPYTVGSWKECSDFCDEYVMTPYGWAEPRFRYSNIFNNKTKAYDIIADILQTCRGFIFHYEGKLRVRIGRNDEQPVFYFAENDEQSYITNGENTTTRLYANLSDRPDNYWAGDIGFLVLNGRKREFIVVSNTSTYLELGEALSSAPDIGSIFDISKQNIKEGTFSWNERKSAEKSNRIRLEFVNRSEVVDDGDVATGSHKYKVDVIEADDTYDIVQTGIVKEVTTKMQGIKRKTQAARMACFLLDSARNTNYTCSFQVDIVGYFLTIGTVIGVSHKVPDWDAADGKLKLFRITNIEEMENFESRLELVEYVSSNYHDNTTGDFVKTPDFSMKNTYTKPLSVERLTAFEDPLYQRIGLAFKKADNDSTWMGTYAYKRIVNGEWEPFTLKNDGFVSPSIELNGNISISDTTIPFNPSTLYLTFPSSGSFFLDKEEIYYASINDELDQFEGCERGFNNTDPATHNANSLCILRQTTYPYYEYSLEEVGLYLEFKVVSKSIDGMVSNAGSAPSCGITISGINVTPFSPALVQLNNQGNGRVLSTDEDAVLSWYATTDGINKGYGFIYGNDAGYGGGTLEGVYRFKLEIINTNSGVVIRTVYIDAIDIATYTYTSAMNISDNGGYETDLTFKIYQINDNNFQSYPFILITNS